MYTEQGLGLPLASGSCREGRIGTPIQHAVVRCSLGALLVAATGKGICTIEFGDSPEVLVQAFRFRLPQSRLAAGDAAFDRMAAQVAVLVEEPGRGHDLPLDIGGTPFQQRVWQTLGAIPAGTTASYARIAADIGAPAAVRAVAGACAANVLAVAVPCHRVVRSDGALSGYRWGAARKRALLDRERQVA